MQLPIEFKRPQFPLRLGFAMLINKSQGQTIKIGGLHLQEHCFSHGQFYVGCSRVGRESNLYMLPQMPNFTRNVVHQEVLWFVLTSYFPCQIVFLSYATLIAVSAYVVLVPQFYMPLLWLFAVTFLIVALLSYAICLFLLCCTSVHFYEFGCKVLSVPSLRCNAVAPLCIWKYWFVQFNFYCPVVSLTLMQCSSPLCICKSSVGLLLFFSFQCITHIDHWCCYISFKLCVC